MASTGRVLAVGSATGVAPHVDRSGAMGQRTALQKRQVARLSSDSSPFLAGLLDSGGAAFQPARQKDQRRLLAAGGFLPTVAAFPLSISSVRLGIGGPVTLMEQSSALDPQDNGSAPGNPLGARREGSGRGHSTGSW